MNALTGTGRLVRLALRRDRLVLAAWVVGLTVFLAMTTHMSVQGLPTQQDVVTQTQFMAANPGMRLLSLSAGASVGAYAMSRSYLTLAILAAVMSILAVVRHTRQSEERGRDELLRAGVVGPAASLAAAVVVALAANAVLAPLLALAMIANGQPAAGSLAAGAAIAAVGVAFTGVAAATSQVSSTGRGANGLAMAVLAVAFVVSGVGNMLGQRGRERPGRPQRVADLAFSDRVGLSAAPVRRRSLVAPRPVRRLRRRPDPLRRSVRLAARPRPRPAPRAGRS